MMHTPTSPEIHAAELRLVQAERNARDSLGRARVAFRATLARPSTLAVLAGAAGLFGFWFARRPRPQTQSAANGAKIATVASTAVLVRTFIMRHAMKALPFVLQQFRAAGQERAARDGVERAEASVAGPSGNGPRN